jgi:hypothetical protein
MYQILLRLMDDCRNDIVRFWHSEERASWYILVMKANKMHYFSNLFDKLLYMFRTGPLSIIRSISTFSTCNRYLSCQLCWLSASVVRILTTLTDANRTNMTNTYCVCTLLRYSWWCTVDLSETCRVRSQIHLRNSASRWLSL